MGGVKGQEIFLPQSQSSDVHYRKDWLHIEEGEREREGEGERRREGERGREGGREGEGERE